LFYNIKKLRNSKNQKLRKQSGNEGALGGPVMGDLLCAVFVWVWLIACLFNSPIPPGWDRPQPEDILNTQEHQAQVSTEYPHNSPIIINTNT